MVPSPFPNVESLVAISRKQVANECIAQHAGRLWQPVSAIATAVA